MRSRMQPEIPSTRELAMVLFRRKRIFVCVAGLVLVAAIFYALCGAKYEANMQILVRRGRANAPVSSGENAPLDLTRTAIGEEELNSEVELLRDPGVLRKVAEEAGLGNRDWLHFLRPSEGPAQRLERAARRLAKRLNVAPAKRTNLIAVRYSADDPQLAAKVLRSLAKVYVAKHVIVHRPSGEFSFFEQQTAEARQQLEDAKLRLVSFTKEQGVVAAAQQRDLAVAKLSELQAGASRTNIELAETQQRIAELEALLAKLPERTTTQVRTADNPDLLRALKSNLLELQLKRTQLLTKFEPSHRLVREVDQQIAQAQTAIVAESLTPVRDETTDKNPQYEWAKSELQQARVQAKMLLAREAATGNQVAAFHALAEKLGAAAVTQDELQASEKAAQESYLLYVKKQEEARMDDALDERRILNVAIAEEPIAPALPVRSPFAVVALGFFASLAAGTGAAFVADYLDPAFRNPDDVRTYLDAPVLASLPKNLVRELSA